MVLDLIMRRLEPCAPGLAAIALAVGGRIFTEQVARLGRREPPWNQALGGPTRRSCIEV